MKFQSQHYSKLHKENNIIYNNHQSSKSELKQQQKVVKRSKIGDVTKLYVLLAEAAGIFYTFAEFTSLTKWIIPV